jgi:hypothetical protein
MRGALFLSAVAAGLSLTAASPPAHAAHARPQPVVVELFTAQGCVSCPEANRLLADMADRVGVIALTFPVDYWDYLGWRDTFAKAEFTERQRAYVARLKVREIYTPEIVVNGRSEGPGQVREKVEALIAAAASDRLASPKVALSASRARVSVSPRPGGGSEDVWLVRYDPVERDVRVKTGDNKGKLVAQRDVVRELVQLGRVASHVRGFDLPAASDSGLKTLILVQGVRGGPILAAKLVPDKPA